MTTDIRRGDIYLIDFDPPKGLKPKAGSEIVKRSIMDALALSLERRVSDQLLR